ncbi:FAD-dependent oxidoreductase [Nocardioidaceae bacterium]|nr:FAD-dependent oxidoreductase [Nocardioidaceae bacterium]
MTVSSDTRADARSRVLQRLNRPSGPSRQREDDRVWDVLVVGCGTAGLVAAKTAARMGAHVLVVESGRLGGDCLFTGCVPSKTLLAAARSGADFDTAMDRVRDTVTAIAPDDDQESLEATGAVVRPGRVRFTGPGEADVSGRTARFLQAVIATGASPALPPIEGLADADPLTSETVWDLAELPSRLTVLGGGPIGCELAQAFAGLGSTVTLVEVESRLLGAEDPDAAAVVADALVADGVDVRLGQAATRVDATGVTLADGSTVAHDRVLVALGRTPRTGDLDLDRVGVETDERGFVVVDETLRSSNPRILAAGDVTGGPQFTHVAGVHGSTAGSNAALGLKRSVTDVVPRVTYTHPEVAAVGAPTHDLPSGWRTLTTRHAEVDRAVAEGETAGFSRLVVDRRGRIRGGTVVGPRAGESLGEVSLAVSQGVKISGLAGVIHPYPTYNDGIWSATTDDLRRTLEGAVVSRALKGASRGRRLWLRARDRVSDR